jgi:uncharacterized OB-fold protein
MSDVRACAACGRLQSFAVPVCRGCGSGRFAACATLFSAEIYSFTCVSRAPNQALQAEAPYTSVLVRGMQGGLLLLRWRDQDPPAIGATVRVRDANGMLVAQSLPLEDLA